ncbi:hypothetical protein ACJRO7_002008, partial [Eucalyptus globulus]
MGERKVLKKYHRPGFDPSELPSFGRPKSGQIEGTKFNSRKEVIISKTYLGILIFRFYFKCTNCSAELTIKTDSQNSVYIVEFGVMRNFEPRRKQDEVMENEKRRREAKEMGDAMKCLENKTHDFNGFLQGTSAPKENKLEEEDEVLLKSIVLHTSKDFARRIEHEDFMDEE